MSSAPHETWNEDLIQANEALRNGKASVAEHIYRTLLKLGLPPETQLLALDGLGRSLHIQGRLNEAEDTFLAALRQIQECATQNAQLKTSALLELASLHAEQARWQGAVFCWQQALRHLDQQGKGESALSVQCRQEISKARFMLEHGGIPQSRGGVGSKS